jgi:hypothetical protein
LPNHRSCSFYPFFNSVRQASTSIFCPCSVSLRLRYAGGLASCLLQLPAGITTRNSTCLCLLAASRPVRYALLRHRTAERRRNSNATRVRVRVPCAPTLTTACVHACIFLCRSPSPLRWAASFLSRTHARTPIPRCCTTATPLLVSHSTRSTESRTTYTYVVVVVAYFTTRSCCAQE